MTTVTQGTTGTYTFAANEMVTLALTGSQQARVEVLDATTGKVKYGATSSVSETFGPFNLNDTLSVTAVRGSVVYTISTYTPPATGGGGSWGTITGTLTSQTDLNTAFNAKLNLALGWNGSTPALASSTNPITAGFGSNSFVYTGAGTSPTLDGVNGVNGDVFIFGQGGSATWGVVPKHDPSAVLTSQVGAASGVASLDSSGYVPSTQASALTGDVTRAAGTSVTVLAPSAPALSQQSTNGQTGTTYTLVLADAGNNVDMNNASANTLTIPPNSSVAFPIGTLITVTMVGAGVTTIAAGAGVTIVKPTARSLAISAQYETAQLYKTGTDTWRVLAG